MFKRFAAFTILFSALFILSGCVQPPKPPTSPTLGQIRTAYIQQLRLKNIQFVQTGETLLISLPTDKIFYPNSGDISSSGQASLQPLARLLATYQIQTLQISGHSDNSCGNEAYNQALTRKQAQQVAKYLANYGLDARLIYAQGYGSTQPIASNVNTIGQLQNRRVDIQLRFLSGLNE